MKKILTNISVLTAVISLSTAFSSCSSHDEESGVYVPLTLEATRAEYNAGNQTRTLSEKNGALVSTWKTTDKVTVYKKGWSSKIGEVAPKQDSNNARTKLDGTVNSSGMNVGDKMDLITPRTEWDYTGQDGTLEKISTNYDFATAEAQVIYLDAENNNQLYASNALFNPQQTIIKFVLKNEDGSAALSVPSLTIVSGAGKIVQSRSLDGATKNYGGLVITPSAATNIYYVAICNDQEGADSYTLTARANNTVYCYTKENVTFKKGDAWVINVHLKDMNNTYSERVGYDNKGETTWQ